MTRLRQPSGIRCDRLTKLFGGVRALDEVTLSFPSSGIVGIIGPNGAGKTTFLNVMTGFIQPDQGMCYIGNREITGLSPHRIVHLGVARTFQDLRLIEHASVLENVMLARPHQRGEALIGALLRLGVSKQEHRNQQEAERLLSFVGLTRQKSQPAGTLSYGQQKLLTLACCLATDAGALLLDEPVAGVQPEMAQTILRLLAELRRNGKLIVFVEHDISAVRAVADIVVVLDDGKVIAEGAPASVLEQPRILEAYIG